MGELTQNLTATRSSGGSRCFALHYAHQSVFSAKARGSPSDESMEERGTTTEMLHTWECMPARVVSYPGAPPTREGTPGNPGSAHVRAINHVIRTARLSQILLVSYPDPTHTRARSLSSDFWSFRVE